MYVSQSVQSLSHVQLFGTLWTAACQALLSMGFSHGWDRGSDSGYGVWGSGTMFGYVVRIWGMWFIVWGLKAFLAGEEEAAQPRQVESPACTELSALQVWQSSGSAQSPDLAEFPARGCSAGGSPCPDLPCF